MSAELDAERVLLQLSLSKENWEPIQSLNPDDFLDSKSKSLWEKISKWHIDKPGQKMNCSWLRMAGAGQEELDWINVRSDGDDAQTLSRAIHSAAARRRVGADILELQRNLITPQEFESRYLAVQPDLTMDEVQKADFGDAWARREAEEFKSIGRWKTGFRLMDVDFKYVPGTFGVLTADTGAGKSFLVDDMAFAWAKANGGRWGLIPLEMNRMQRSARWCVGHTDEELSTVFCSDRKMYSFSSIVRTIEDMSKEGVLFWVLDHFHCISNETRDSDVSWQERCAQTLANLAVRLGIYILTPTQISKSGGKKDGEFNKHDIRGAKGICDAAADIFILNRGDDIDSLVMDKSRFTPTGFRFPVLFDWQNLRATITDFQTASKEKSVQDIRSGGGIRKDGHF